MHTLAAREGGDTFPIWEIVDEVYANGSHHPVSTIRQRISYMMCHEAPEIRGTIYFYHDLERVARGHYKLVED